MRLEFKCSKCGWTTDRIGEKHHCESAAGYKPTMNEQLRKAIEEATRVGQWNNEVDVADHKASQAKLLRVIELLVGQRDYWHGVASGGYEISIDNLDAELIAALEEMRRFMREALKRVEEKQQTIAKQAKVIEKLREQRDIELEDNCWDDASTGGRPFEQTRAMMEAEIEAINKLEDFKKV